MTSASMSCSAYVDGGSVGRDEQDDTDQNDGAVGEHGCPASNPVAHEAKEQLPQKNANQLKVIGGLRPCLWQHSDQVRIKVNDIQYGPVFRSV